MLYDNSGEDEKKKKRDKNGDVFLSQIKNLLKFSKKVFLGI